MLAQVNRRVRPLIALTALLAVTAWGASDGDTPEAALKALVTAANHADDKAVAELTCPEAREGATIAGIKADAAQPIRP